MTISVLSRRKFVTRGASAAVTFFSALGCGGKKSPEKSNTSGGGGEPCGDLSGVSENDIELRKKFAYVEESPIADNQCSNCNLYLPPKAESKCGGCMLFKGPVKPSAYCTYWAPKV